MGCGGKINNRCGNEVPSVCVQYELDLPDFSEITDDCYSIEQTTEDQYNLIGEVKSEIDLTELGNTCLSYVQEDGKTIVKNVLLKYEEEICSLKETVEDMQNGTSLCNQDITGCGIDFGVLEDACGQTITTFKQMMQAFADQINANTP